MLVVTVDKRGQRDRAFPPSDAADADCSYASGDPDLRVGQRMPRLFTEVHVHDLGVLMQQRQRLQIRPRTGLLQQRVVTAEDRAARRYLQDLGVGLRGPANAPLRTAPVDRAL